MSRENNKSVPAAYLLLKKDGRILLGRRANTTYYDGWYGGAAAGHIEARELPTEALVREAKEEIGIDIKLEDVIFCHAMYRVAHDETGDRVDYFFTAKTWTGEPKIMEPDKCDDLQWFDIDALPENTIHHERLAIENIEKGIVYSQVDKEHTFLNPSRPKNE